MNSREYAKFKRNFVGPLMSRRIKRQRRDAEISIKPIENLDLQKGDIRRTWGRSDIHRYAMPKWDSKEKIKEIYKEAKRLTEETGIIHHVDHIIPVKHPLVCGLHTVKNLRVISWHENLKKSNKLDDLLIYSE